jgi:hypothetical protein
MNKLDRYGCPYQFAKDYLIKYGIRLEEKENGGKYENSNEARQVIKVAIEALEKQIKINKKVHNISLTATEE